MSEGFSVFAQKYEKDSAEIRDFAKSVALAAAGAGAPPHVVSEHAELVDACMQQHAKLLDGPVKLQGARMEMLVQDVRAPLIGNAVATSGLQQPISRPVTSPIAAPPQESDVPQPSFSRVRASSRSNAALPAQQKGCQLLTVILCRAPKVRTVSGSRRCRPRSTPGNATSRLTLASFFKVPSQAAT